MQEKKVFIKRADFRPPSHFLCQIGPNRPGNSKLTTKPQRGMTIRITFYGYSPVSGANSSLSSSPTCFAPGCLDSDF